MPDAARTTARRALQGILQGVVALVLLSAAGNAAAGPSGSGHAHGTSAAPHVPDAPPVGTAAKRAPSMSVHAAHAGTTGNGGGDEPGCEPPCCDVACAGACPAAGTAVPGSVAALPPRLGTAGHAAGLDAHGPPPRLPDVPFRPPIPTASTAA